MYMLSNILWFFSTCTAQKVLKLSRFINALRQSNEHRSTNVTLMFRSQFKNFSTNTNEVWVALFCCHCCAGFVHVFCYLPCGLDSFVCIMSWCLVFITARHSQVLCLADVKAIWQHVRHIRCLASNNAQFPFGKTHRFYTYSALCLVRLDKTRAVMRRCGTALWRVSKKGTFRDFWIKETPIAWECSLTWLFVNLSTHTNTNILGFVWIQNFQILNRTSRGSTFLVSKRKSWRLQGF